jgi:drug/metabolite transporter (DMT)-like permease
MASGVLFVFGLYCLFVAIARNEVSRIVPLFGALVAIFTLLISAIFSVEKLDGFQFIAFMFLLFGGVVISLKIFDIKSLTKEAVIFSAIGAFLVGASFTAIKFVFLHTDFLNGFVLSRIGTFLTGFAFLLAARGRDIPSVNIYLRTVSPRTLWLFLFNRASAAIFSLLQNYAVFLGSVVLVQALSGVQYVFLILLTAFFSFKYPAILVEKFTRKSILVKSAAIFLISFGLLILAFSAKPADLAPGLRDFGATFSKFRAEEFGLDWQRTYIAILDDLGVRKIRLSAYWTDLEPKRDEISFFNLDWQIAEAERRGAEIILAVGQRLPRWPECHIPGWAWDLPKEERQRNLLEIIEQTVFRYRDNPLIKYWQVENEPFLPGFGICPPFDKEFLDKEIALVKSLDSRPIIISDSGELSVWLQAARRADIFGTTMYRIIWSDRLPGDGYLHYPVPPNFFYLKANLIKYFSGTKDIIVTELQAEPWGPKMTYEMPASERDKSLNIDQFKDNIAYATEVGFREAYLWGVEWWLWERDNGRPEFWEYAKTLFR